ncbi:hypothetical protein WN51_00396 [Melipona quadrifasciata]|uniref:Uncharacterized protein n=1 Tax=Melipona quadrifasciata TaxID=166423 RepID=A0A0M9A306_9HYME|nr:hypothetical protein WN51_00396 [Melipona quadrifasciata]
MRKEGIGIGIFFMYFFIQEKENDCVYIEEREEKKRERHSERIFFEFSSLRM